MNFVTAKLVREDGPAVAFAGHRLPVPAAVLAARPEMERYAGRDVILGVRPSDFEDASLADPGWPRIGVQADVTEELGSEIHVIFTIDAPIVEHSSLSQAITDEDDDSAIALGEGKSQWTARVAARSHVKAGQRLELAVDTTNLHYFDPGSGLAIGDLVAGSVRPSV
jgi:multiple sugar transport system ATP-binding protein